MAELGQGSHWTPTYHDMYSDRFRAIIATLFVLWQRPDTPFSLLPLEIMHDVIRAIDPMPPTAAPVVRSFLASANKTNGGNANALDHAKLERLPQIVVKTLDLMNPPLPETNVLSKLALEWKVIPDAYRLCHRFYLHAEECMGDKATPGGQL